MTSLPNPKDRGRKGSFDGPEISSATIVIAGLARSPQHSLLALTHALIGVPGLSSYKIQLQYHLIEGCRKDRSDKRSLEQLVGKQRLPAVPQTLETYPDHPESFGTAEIEARAAVLRNPYSRHSLKSVNNHLRLLGLLNTISPVVNTDLVIFARADLVPVGDVNLEPFLELARTCVVTPSWHTWGGVNDRFAMMPRSLQSIYFERVGLAMSHMQTGLPIHGETFLAKALAGIRVASVIESQFARCQSGGAVKNENFHATRHVARQAFIRFQERWDNSKGIP